MFVASKGRVLAALVLLTAPQGAAAAQAFPGPQPSLLWATAPLADPAPSDDAAARSAMSRSTGLQAGALVGGLAAGFLGYRVCQAYSAVGDCTGDALWWAVLGAMLGGLIGASGAEESNGGGG